MAQLHKIVHHNFERKKPDFRLLKRWMRGEVGMNGRRILA
jgi:hypothetical protein